MSHAVILAAAIEIVDEIRKVAHIKDDDGNLIDTNRALYCAADRLMRTIKSDSISSVDELFKLYHDSHRWVVFGTNLKMGVTDLDIHHHSRVSLECWAILRLVEKVRPLLCPQPEIAPAA